MDKTTGKRGLLHKFYRRLQNKWRKPKAKKTLNILGYASPVLITYAKQYQFTLNKVNNDNS